MSAGQPVDPPQPAAPSARRSARGERTEKRILKAAELIFAERGFEGASLRDVAEAVGIRIPSLYNYFPNKEALYGAVLTGAIRPVLTALTDYVEADATERRSEDLIARVMTLLAEHPNLPRLVQHEALAGGQRLPSILRDWIAPVFAQSHHVARTVTARWNAEEIEHIVLAIYNVVVGYFTMAPLYLDLNGVDLLDDAALARQSRLLVEITDALFPPEPASSTADSHARS